MIPFGTEKDTGKPYCLPTLTESTAQQIYIVGNIKAIERSHSHEMF